MSGFLRRLSGRAKLDEAAAAVAAAAARRSAAPAPPQDAAAARTIEPAAYGMPPRAALRTDLIRPLPALTAAREAAESTGDWRPASALLEAVGADWELRYLCACHLAELAVREDAWLRAWRQAAPRDPGAAVVHARSLVEIAWAIRGTGWAEGVTAEQWQGFRRTLSAAPEACHEAATLLPEDPVPWIVHLGAATGLSYPNEAFRELWAMVRSRAPYHVPGHLGAMNYWLPRWHGSRELVTGFVEEAIATAPPGSLLTLLRLDLLNNELRPEGREQRREFWRGPEVRHAVDQGLADLAAAHPAHLRIDALRGWLAYFLTRSGRYAEAVWMFRQLGDRVATAPWSYSADGTALFTANRVEAVLGWEDAGRPALPDGRSPLDAAPAAGWGQGPAPAPAAPQPFWNGHGGAR